MAKHPVSITSLPRSLAEDQRRRMILYSTTMTIRIVCLGVCVIVPGWWALVPALGAIFLPYLAVVVANATDARVARVERPGFIVPRTTPPAPEQPDSEQ